MQSLADRTGITRGVINNIEKGRIVSPRYSVIEKIVALSRQYRTPDDFIKNLENTSSQLKKYV